MVTEFINIKQKIQIILKDLGFETIFKIVLLFSF